MGLETERFVAIGLLTAQDLEKLGNGFRYIFPLEQGTDFADLLDAIDEAERAAERQQSRQ